MKQTTTPKKRIDSIDALRGIALMGILVWHSIEHFDLMYTPVIESSFWQAMDTFVQDAARFLFQGKAYAVFSLLFGLSFFIQMDSQADKGYDFRLRFVWRLAILFILGYLNGLIYMGEFFVIYAMVGLVLIPLWKVPTKWLVGLIAILFLQIPQLIEFISLLNGHVPNEPNSLNKEMGNLFGQAANLFIHGSFSEVISFNVFKGQLAKMLWFINEYRYLQLTGLFICGMLIGRYHIHKSEEKMIFYSKKVLPYAFGWFLFFYLIVLSLPSIGLVDYTLEVGTGLFQTYANLGMLVVYISGFTLLYYKTRSGRKVLGKLAPVGRMSVTNYMAQSVIGVTLFYGFGLNLAVTATYLQCILVGLCVCVIQIAYSNWWIKRYYYGPVEWIWRILTWFKPVPLKRTK